MVFGVPVDRVDKDTQRYPCKRVGFGILYGISADGLVDQLPGWSKQECQQLIDDWLNLYAGIRQMMEDIKLEARRYGYVRDMFGRIKYIPEVKSTDRRIVEAGFREAINMPIQAGAAGLLKLAMAALIPFYRRAEYLWKPIVPVHDELIFDVAEDHVEETSHIVKYAMESCYTMRVPIIADVNTADNWEELK